MTTETTTTKQIGLWLDTTSEPSNPAWIVSVDTVDERGDNRTTRTEAVFAQDEREEAEEYAEKIAAERGLQVVES